MIEYYREMEKSIRSAFDKKWNAEHKRKKSENSDAVPTTTNNTYAYVQDIAKDHIVYDSENQLYKLNYSGAADNPVFDDFDSAVKIKKETEYVAEGKSKDKDSGGMDKGTLRSKANILLKKQGKDKLDEDEPIPTWVLKKLKKSKNLLTARQIKRVSVSESKGAYD